MDFNWSSRSISRKNTLTLAQTRLPLKTITFTLIVKQKDYILSMVPGFTQYNVLSASSKAHVPFTESHLSPFL